MAWIAITLALLWLMCIWTGLLLGLRTRRPKTGLLLGTVLGPVGCAIMALGSLMALASVRMPRLPADPDVTRVMRTVDQPLVHQWCTLHNCHQDDPLHDYQYPACEQHQRPSTAEEDIRILDILHAYRIHGTMPS